MKVARGSPTTNHLFFVEDSIIFCQANTKEWHEIQKILDTYETVAGQGINKHKMKIFLAQALTMQWKARF